MPHVNPQILHWARETAGLSLVEAAGKLRLPPTKDLSPEERLAALEAGESQPSQTLLETMAKKYHRPLVTFFMSAPPRKAPQTEDFRTLAERSPAEEAHLEALLRNLKTRQSMLRELLEEEEEVEHLPFVGSSSLSVPSPELAQRIRQLLEVPVEAFRAQRSYEAAFGLLREATETAGVFVLLIGDLGSHHTALDLDTFRGIALADPIAPMIVINDRDAHSAWSFTLIHELAHLFLGLSGVSNAWAENEIEKFCNDVASHYLLPEEDLQNLSLSPVASLERTLQQVDQFAKEHNVSSSLVAYRLYRNSMIDRSRWQSLRNALRERWLSLRETRRKRSDGNPGGPNYYVVRRHRLGTHLIRFIARMMRDGAITTAKAGKVLGIKPTSVHSLVEALS